MNKNDKHVFRQEPITFLVEGSEMEECIRTFDWSKTPLGAFEGWSQSLKAAVRIMLHSRYPMFIWWGQEMINLYNDAYIPVLGKRHPDALGQHAAAVWTDVWPVVGPQAAVVLNEGRATWNEETLLIMERNQFPEETYFTFSYSPIPDDEGNVGGVLCVCTEETERVLSQRRLRTLGALAEQTAQAKTAEDACEVAALLLAENPFDLPFVLLYLLENDGQQAKLAGLTGLEVNLSITPAVVELQKSVWPFELVVETGRSVELPLTDQFGFLPGGAWSEPAQKAVVLPMAKPGQTQLAGFVVAGISPRLTFNKEYNAFMSLLAGHVATAVANARAYHEERQRAEALADLDRAKTTFFSNVSHEFRTPLTLMLGPVEELLKKQPDEFAAADKEQLEIIHRNMLRLLKLVNTMLDFSRIEAGRLQANYEAVDLAQYTAELASIFRSAIEAAGLQLIVDCQPLPEPVYVDRDLWEKIVLNLLSNAFKFTFEGQIEVLLEAVDDQAVLTVRDSGVGIPTAETAQIFDRFHRVKESRGRTFEGTGIGLALVQELVRLHGGSVSAQSQLDEGSTFVVALPFGKTHLEPERIVKSSHATPIISGNAFVQEALRWLPDEPLEETIRQDIYPALVSSYKAQNGHLQALGPRPQIILADDNADMRQYVSRLLTERYDVETAANGQEALELVRTNPPDLILSDVMMPQLDGFGLLREIRQDSELQRIPFILLSARAGEEMRIEGLEAGANDYLIKPFSARELVASIDAHIRMTRVQQTADKAIRESETRYRELSGRLKALLDTTSQLIETLEIEELLLSLLKFSREIVAADALAIWRQDEENNWAVVASNNLSEEFIQESLSSIRDTRVSAAPIVIQPQQLADRSTPLLQHRWERYEREGIHSLMVLSLLIHGKMSGTLVFYCRTPHTFTAVEIEAAQALANIASAAITTAELYETQSQLRQRAEEAAVREAFLSQAGAILSESLDYEQTLINVAHVAVPRFADWCAVDLLDGEGAIRRLAVAHIDPQKVALAQALHEQYPPVQNAATGVPQVIRTGQPEFVNFISDEMLEIMVGDDSYLLHLLRELQLYSYICVPLQAGDNVYGAMTFAAAESKHMFEERDLKTAQEIARRAAQAIENVQLYRNLEDGERRLRLALLATQAAVWELDLASGYTRWSREMELLYGYDAATPRTHEQWLSSLHPDDQGWVTEDFARRLASDETNYQQEFRIIHPQQGVRWIFDVGHIERDESGRAYRCLGINLDITKRKQTEEALYESELRFRRMADTAPAMFWVTDQNQDYIFLSRGWYEYTGQTDGEGLGYGWLQAIHPEDRPHTKETFLQAYKTAAPFRIDYRLRRADGEYHWAIDVGRPRFSDTGEYLGHIGSVIDIHERKQAEESLRLLNEELEQRVAERTNELERQNRRLRQLATQLTEAEQGERRKLAKTLHDGLQQLLIAGKIQLRLFTPDKATKVLKHLEELFDESIRISRSLSYDLSPPALHSFGLPAAIQWLARRFYTNQHFNVAVIVSDDFPELSNHIKFFLFDAVRELLLNSVKHSGGESARVELQVQQQQRIVVVIADEGNGFEPDRLEQEHEDLQGIGLFSIRERLTAFGGSFHIDSSPGAGARFRLTMPITGEEKRNERIEETISVTVVPATANNRHIFGRPIRILIVDDHSIVRKGLVSLLEREEDIEVVGEAADGVEAIAQVEILHPEVIVMDIEMPRLDGVEATRHIKQKYPKIVIIGLSLHEEQDQMAKMSRAGATAYVRKGGDAENLLKIIRDL